MKRTSLKQKATAPFAKSTNTNEKNPDAKPTVMHCVNARWRAKR